MKKNTLFGSIVLCFFLLSSACKKDDPSPVAGFTFSGADVLAPAIVTFTNTSTDASTFIWDFGDGETSSEKNPVHTYLSGKNYIVKLTANGSGGSNSISQTVNILGPAADFTIIGSGSKAPCEISFTDASTHATSWHWDFGDGQSSTQQNPNHTFTTANGYGVKLTVTGPSGSNSVTKTVDVLPAPTICKITQVILYGCPQFNPGGSFWDQGSNPDYYFNIESTSGTVLFDGSLYVDLDSGLPVYWLLSTPYIITNTDWNTMLRVHIWDQDGPDSDDDMTECSFKVVDYATPDISTHYPAQILLTAAGNTQIEVHLQWE